MRRFLIGTLCVAGFAGAASAETFDLGDVSGKVLDFNNYRRDPGVGGTIDDSFDFTVGHARQLEYVLLTDDLSARLTTDNAAHETDFSHVIGGRFTPAIGHYDLHIFGVASQDYLGTYQLEIDAKDVAPVPGPSGGVVAIAGAALLGWALYRRRPSAVARMLPG